MRIGITLGLNGRTIASVADRAREIERLGFDSAWVPWGSSSGFDPVMALVAVGREATRLELGTAVVPTFLTHPVAMAQRALTAQSRRP